VVSSYVCSTASAGTMSAGTVVSRVTQTITATVATVGTYSIAIAANGVVFVGSGTFTGTGAQAIVLTATGTPTTAPAFPHTFPYALNTTPSCSFNRIVLGINDVLSTTGRIWMDRNLGATQVATSSADHLAYGSLYQWGRGNDGHQLINWTSSTAGTPVNGTTSTLSTTDSPVNNLFITRDILPMDWRSTPNNLLWQGVNGVNNPCPTGYRLPTEAELQAERNNGGTNHWGTGVAQNNAAGAFGSVLKLPLVTFRRNSTGDLFAPVGSDVVYLTSTISLEYSRGLNYNSSSAVWATLGRAIGCSVRCLKH